MNLKIRKWDEWQSYRKDRGQPPWIKVYRALLRDPEWVALTDAQRGQLVAIWLLAADRNGVIPASPSLIKKLCFMDKEPDVEMLIAHGFIEGRRRPDAIVTPTGRQDDAPEESRGEKSREEESRGDLSSTCVDPPPLTASGKPKGPTPEALVDFWNGNADPSLARVREVTGKRLEKLKTRLKEHPDGVFWKRVVDRINGSAFLRGRRKGSAWKVTFDWIIENDSNAVKIAEGQYDDESRPRATIHDRIANGSTSHSEPDRTTEETDVDKMPELRRGVEQTSPVSVSGRERES